jgi:hypothetical protein
MREKRSFDLRMIDSVARPQLKAAVSRCRIDSS